MTNTKELQKKIQKKYDLNEGFSVNNNEPHSHTSVQTPIQKDSKTDNHTSYTEHEKQTAPQSPRLSYARKMTLNVTEDVYKAFTDIYATRLLQGRATEKSALICEAITLLYAKEKNEGNKE